MDEQWREIEGFEGRYQISSNGRVRSLARKIEGCVPRDSFELVMQQYEHNNGYRVVHLKTPMQRKKAFVHRLVGKAFLSNPEEKAIVNHKDRDRTNNDLSNLEWVTEEENRKHWMDDDREKRRQKLDAVNEPEFDPADLPW